MSEEQQDKADETDWKQKYEQLLSRNVTDLNHFAHTWQKQADRCARAATDDTLHPSLAIQMHGQAQAHSLTALVFRSMASDISLGRPPKDLSLIDRMYELMIDMSGQYGKDE